MKAEIFENQSTVVIKTELQTVELEDNLHMFKLTTSSEQVDNTGTVKADVGKLAPEITAQGFLDTKNLKALKAGKKYTTRPLSYLSKRAQELFRTKGWNAWDDKADLELRADMFEQILKVKDLDTIVHFDYSSHMMFDRHGKPLPVAVNFDYISNGGITDGRYDLEKLAAHLLSREDIWVYPCKDRKWYPDAVDYTGRATEVEQCITAVPYYNAERGCSKTIYFRWMPTADDYRRMWDLCVANKKQFPSTYRHQAIFDLDLIGARAAGAALFDSYHKTTKYDNCGND